MITSTAIAAVEGDQAVRLLLVAGGDVVNQWAMITIITAAVMEAEVVTTGGDAPDHIRLPRLLLHPRLHRPLLPVPTAVQVMVGVGLHGVDEEDPHLMIVLLGDELVEAVEAVETIAV